MSSLSDKALLHFEQSPNLEWQDLNHHINGVVLSSLGDNYITDATTDSFELVQRLDTRLRAHIKSGDYDSAMNVALDMQKCMPAYYYGYERGAQIHLIRNEPMKAHQVYTQGFKAVSKSSGYNLLWESAVKTGDLLDQVATELARNGRLERAHEMANWILCLLPNSPAGYIRRGEILEMQGKNTDAEDVYYRGVSKVASVAPKNLDSLVEHLVHVKRQIKRNPRCDYITQLPFEVASYIIQRLRTCDLLVCMEVSTNWKERIRQCVEAWRVITLHAQREKLDTVTIQHIKSFIHKIELIGLPKKPCDLDILLTSIADKKFVNLMEIGLDITYSTIDIDDIPLITRIFESNKVTSLSMQLDDEEDDAVIVEQAILKSCTNLKQLKYCLYNRQYTRLFDGAPEPTKITHLTLDWTWSYEIDATDNDYFIELAPLFPNLVYLWICYCNPDSLPTITASCPKLCQLIIDESEINYSNFTTHVVQKNSVDGLQSIQIFAALEPKDVFDTIVKYTTTLEYADVVLHKQCEKDSGLCIDTDWDWKSISKINAPVLKTFHMQADYFWPFDELVGNCPALKDVNLKVVSDDDDNDRGW